MILGSERTVAAEHDEVHRDHDHQKSCEFRNHGRPRPLVQGKVDRQNERNDHEVAHRIAQNAPVAVALAKSILNKSLNVDLPTLLEMEALAAASCMTTEDHQEGITAFREKRQVTCKGK